VANRPQLPDRDYEAMPAEGIVATFLDAFPGRVSLACSFQKEETVLLDMLLGLDPKARVFALDTHVLFPETYAVWREVERRYGTSVEVYQGPSLGRQAAAHGDALWARNPALCCSIRKVGPLGRALADLDAWITGLRRDQWATRTDIRKVEIDHDHGAIVKLNPLAEWTEDEVWDYVRERGVPYHPLYDRGYTSIGCAPCTRAIAPGEAARDGRWWWEENAPKECGIHCAVETGGLEHELHAILGEEAH